MKYFGDLFRLFPYTKIFLPCFASFLRLSPRQRATDLRQLPAKRIALFENLLFFSFETAFTVISLFILQLRISLVGSSPAIVL
jgi:hypothetical protein